MKRIISLFSIIGLGSNSILMFNSNIYQQTKINDIKYGNNKNTTNNLKKSKSNNIQQGVYLYNPNVKINSINDNPFLNLSNVYDQSYFDNVFLKSLNWDKNKKTIYSSEENLNQTDLLNSNYNQSQDDLDYQKMISLVNPNNLNDTAISEGLTLVNRYLNNGLLKFNLKGYVPSRQEFYSNDITKTQTKITLNSTKTNNLTSITDYININLHWYGVDLKLEPKLIDFGLLTILNSSAQTVNILEKGVTAGINFFISKLCKKLQTKMFEFAQELLADVDVDLVEDPELIIIIDPIYELVAYVITKYISLQIKNAAEQTADKFIYNLFHCVFYLKHKFHSITEKDVNFEIEVDVHWLIWNSKFKLNILKPKIKRPLNILPSLPTPVMKNIHNLLVGNTNDFTMILNANSYDDWYKASLNGDANKYLQVYNLKNSNIILTNDEWVNIAESNKLENFSSSNSYYAAIHVVNKKVVYTNMNSESTYHDFPAYKNSLFVIQNIIGTQNNFSLIFNNSQLNKYIQNYLITNNPKSNLYWKNNNPDNYTTHDDWFYNTEFEYYNKSKAFWISKNITQEMIMKVLSNYINNYINQQSISSKNSINFKNLVNNTTDNNNAIIIYSQNYNKNEKNN